MRAHALWDVLRARQVAFYFADVARAGEKGAKLVRWTPVRMLRMLGSMRYLGGARGLVALCAAVFAQALVSAPAAAQGCTTQARMSAAQRTEVGNAAFGLATAVLAGDANRVRTATVAQYASDFTQSGYLIQSTAGRIAGDTLAVTQAYLLDNTARPAGGNGEAEFACALSGTVAETDFAIPGLPAGRFAFVMVEARGASPWLLSFLLEQEGGTWKMAGFYPHERTVAGHDGVWYWSQARADAKGDKPWLAWVMFGEADQLLRPAPFVTSANRDKLLGEQRTAAPEPLSNGLSAQAPLSLVGSNGTQFQVTSLAAGSSEGEKTLNLVMHIQGQSGMTSEAATARNVAAATALLSAHAELRQGFSNIWVIADLPGSNPLVVQRPVSEIVAEAR